LAAAVVGALAAAGLVAVWIAGGHTRVEGALAALSLGSLAVALVGVARRAAPPELDEEPREPSLHEVSPERRRLIIRMVFGGLAVLGLGSIFPIRQELRRARRALASTAWRPGTRVVTDDGRPVRVEDLAVGGLLTIYPVGRLDAADSQAVLIRLEPGRLVTGPGRPEWTVADYVAYSKLCTHMGCPVGLYQRRSQALLCPCHQASFDVLRGGRPTRGPARRALPQLPLEIDPEGFLQAGGDFGGPVGSGYWDLPT
jgi:ubiquinol-cytochrome c reductase iron-sulfur subunit